MNTVKENMLKYEKLYNKLKKYANLEIIIIFV